MLNVCTGYKLPPKLRARNKHYDLTVSVGQAIWEWLNEMNWLRTSCHIAIRGQLGMQSHHKAQMGPRPTFKHPRMRAPKTEAVAFNPGRDI